MNSVTFPAASRTNVHPGRGLLRIEGGVRLRKQRHGGRSELADQPVPVARERAEIPGVLQDDLGRLEAVASDIGIEDGCIDLHIRRRLLRAHPVRQQHLRYPVGKLSGVWNRPRRPHRHVRQDDDRESLVRIARDVGVVAADVASVPDLPQTAVRADHPPARVSHLPAAVQHGRCERQGHRFRPDQDSRVEGFVPPQQVVDARVEAACGGGLPEVAVIRI